jgi:hypothetical protein
MGIPMFAGLTIDRGRIVYMGGRNFGTWSQNYHDAATGTDEKISIQSNNQRGSAHYERKDPEEQLSLDIGPDDRFSIGRSNRGKSTATPVRFVQMPHEQISLIVGPDGAQKTYRASNLWLLMLSQPAECQQHLLPLLDILPCLAQIKETAKAVETELLKVAVTGTMPERRHLGELVKQLGADEFAKREAADRLLRAAGPSVAYYLEQLDYAKLDAEQQFRVRRIADSFHGKSIGDTPEQVAIRLSADPAAWLALLDRPEKSTRQAAAKQLAGLLDEPIGVDPAADPASQKSQREQLRTKIEQRKPRGVATP